MDSATEYEKNAQDYLCRRDESPIGDKVVRQWAQKMSPYSEVIEVACGGGYPVTKELSEAGLKVWAIDSSKTLLTEFKKRFPDITVKCERVQETSFFGKQFDAAIAIGLIFLLPEPEQDLLLGRISNALKSGGRFLFTAPTEEGTWNDLTTGISCSSLGVDKYTKLLNKHGLEITSTIIDAGGNNHYETVKTA